MSLDVSEDNKKQDKYMNKLNDLVKPATKYFESLYI